MSESEMYRLIAVLLDEANARGSEVAKLLESHNNLTVEILKEIQTQRKETMVWWLIAMLVIMGSFWSYL